MTGTKGPLSPWQNQLAAALEPEGFRVKVFEPGHDAEEGAEQAAKRRVTWLQSCALLIIVTVSQVQQADAAGTMATSPLCRLEAVGFKASAVRGSSFDDAGREVAW